MNKPGSKEPARVTFLGLEDQDRAQPHVTKGAVASTIGATCKRLADACRDRSWQVATGSIDSLVLFENKVRWRIQNKTKSEWQGPQDTALVWVLGFGRRASFLDKIQLLALAEKTVPIINSPTALAFWHGKYMPVSLHTPDLQMPQMLASKNTDWLWSEICERGGSWVAKPPGGSGGQDVYKIQANNPKDRDILQRSAGDTYCLIQQYIPEIAEGEKRVLLAGHSIIGQYLRIPTTDFRANLAQGARAESCDLSTDETRAMQHLARALCEEGILFAAVDLCWPWLIEINITNPGGLETIAQLSGQDLAAKVLDAIEPLLQFDNGRSQPQDAARGGEP